MNYQNFNTMRNYGGSFLKAICEAFCQADASNTRKLKKAFPEVARAYSDCNWDKELNKPVNNPFA